MSVHLPTLCVLAQPAGLRRGEFHRCFRGLVWSVGFRSGDRIWPNPACQEGQHLPCTRDIAPISRTLFRLFRSKHCDPAGKGDDRRQAHRPLNNSNGYPQNPVPNKHSIFRPYSSPILRILEATKTWAAGSGSWRHAAFDMVSDPFCGIFNGP